MSKNNYILGGGVAGLIAAFYNPDYHFIDLNPMGQLNAPFIPGPRIIKDDKNSRNFLDKLKIKYAGTTAEVGYVNKQNIAVHLTDEFKKNYSIITRGTDIVEKSFLSSGESSIKILSDGSDDFYNSVFKKLYELVKDRHIASKVSEISLKNKVIKLEDGTLLSYDKCISTLNLNIFCSLAGISKYISPEIKTKNFVCCKYNEQVDIELSKKFDYVYSISGLYSRKTYFDDYIVYETILPTHDSKILEGNEIIKTANNVPIQIVNSIDIQNIGGIEMLGRFAQWKHSIKSNEIIDKYESTEL